MSHRTHLSVASALVTAGLLVAAGNAQALDAEVSGHVNRAVMFADNGEENDVFFVDNGNSNTRFRFVGSEEILPGIKAGIKWEMEFFSQQSSSVDFGERHAGDSQVVLDERHQDIYFQGAFGKFSIGQGDTAGNGAAEVDLSGTSVVSYSSMGDIAGGLTFEDNSDWDYSNHDFNSRRDRVRYDTPALGPAILSASYGNGDDDDIDVYDFAARASTDLPGVGKVAGALAYGRADATGGDEVETIGGSVSFLSDVGANVSFTYTRQSTDDGTTEADDDTFYVKLGYKMGQHAVSVDYGMTTLENDDKFSGYGAQYVFKPISWAELYAGVKQHAADLDTGSDPDNITIALVGSRIKF